MAKTTTNLGLIKPEKSDNYSVDVMAGNMDVIDEKLGRINIDEDGNIVGRIFSVYNVEFYELAISFNNIPYMILQPSPTITYSCPSTLSVNFGRSASQYGVYAGTIEVYSFDGLEWSLYSSTNTGTSFPAVLSVNFPEVTHGVWIRVIGGSNYGVSANLIPVLK